MRDTDTCGDVSPRSTTPDPANPKVRDAFLDTIGRRVTIATVGAKWTLVHYPSGDEYPVLRSDVACWTPAPPPVITEDVTLREKTLSPCSKWWSSTGANEVNYDTGRAIVIHPDHTWTEVAA
jgi:hypothetical protein